MPVFKPHFSACSHIAVGVLLVAAASLSACDDDDSPEPAADTVEDLPGDMSNDLPDDLPDDTADSAFDILEDEAPDIPPLDFDLYVRGSFNGWEATDQLSYVGDTIYAGTVLISAGAHEFKIADEVWTGHTIYSAHASEMIEVPLDTETPLVSATGYNNNAVLQITEEAEYTFAISVTIDASDVPQLTLIVSKGSDIPIGELPDDSQVEVFDATPYEDIELVGGPGLPTPEELFEQLAIVVPAGEQVQFIYGDHLDGYYEGWTQAYSSATRYWLRSGFLLSYVATLIDAELNDLETDTTETHILPYGVRNYYGDEVWDEVILHAPHRAVSVRIHSDTPGRLALIPKLNLKRNSSSFERYNDTMVYALDESLRRDGVPPFLAVAGNRPYQLHGADLEAMPFLTDRANILETDVKPLITTTGDETDFRVVFAFGFTREQAAEEASNLIERDAVGVLQSETYDLLTTSYLWTDDLAYNRALMWAKLSAFSMVNEEYGVGIWAGLPWFKTNWGRDTFIALPGTLLVSGLFELSRAVIREFAALQNIDAEDVNFGRIPNRVAGPEDVIYNTTDGTPWMVREILETVRYTGDSAFASEMFPVVDRYISGAIDNYADDEGFLTHDDADTWMDARFGELAEYPWSARGDRAVEIQALWYSALRIGADMAADAGEAAKAAQWDELADTLRGHFVQRFWDDSGDVLADRVRADNTHDDKVRPNQLMVVSIPFDDRLVDAEVEAHVVANTANELLFEHGIASLSQNHDYFHPHHDNQPTFNKDAAYHNGTVWLWNAGFAVTALTRFGYTDHAYALTTNMVEQTLEMGTRGSLSELLDAHPDEDGEVILSGTFSQSWSVSEFARNGYQDYLGFRPNLIDGRIALWPALPSGWDSFHAQCAFGDGGRLLIDFARGDGGELSFTVETSGHSATLGFDFVVLGADRARYRISFDLPSAMSRVVVFDPDAATATVDGTAATVHEELASQDGVIGVLEFVTPDVDGEFPTMLQNDYLEGIIEEGEFE